MVAQLDRTFLRVAPGRAASRLVGYLFFEGRPATTRGRWWNPVVFGNLRIAATRPGGQIDRPVFIVGMGRSGTTLLGRILAAHPTVGFLNEPKAMWHVIRDDEDIIGSYAQSGASRLYLGADEADEEVRRRARALFSWYLRASRSKRLVDKYPELVFRHAFIRSIFPDARFLVAIRSPWSTFKSVASWSETHATQDADWWGVQDRKWDILWAQAIAQASSNSALASTVRADETDHHVRAAAEWVVTMREAASLAELDPLAQIVRYEELVQQPREVIRKALRFCGLPTSARTEDYAAAIVSSQDSTGVRETPLHLTDDLTSAIKQTWSRLETIN